jgi:hypothetical protein
MAVLGGITPISKDRWFVSVLRRRHRVGWRAAGLDRAPTGSVYGRTPSPYANAGSADGEPRSFQPP